MAEQSRNAAVSTVNGPAPATKAVATGGTVPAQRTTLIDAKLNLAGEDRRQLIAEAAYFRAEQRDFRPGAELDDWLAAEIEIDTLLGAEDIRN